MATTPPFPEQALPDWMTYILVTDPVGAPTWSIVTLPLTYYGPWIPLGTDGVWTYGGPTPPATATPIITATQPPVLTTAPTPTVTVQLTVTPAPPVTKTLVTTIATPTTTITGSVAAEGSGTLSSPVGNSPSTTDTHIFPSVNTTASPTQNTSVNAHTYLGLPPDSFLGLVIGVSILGLLFLCCCLAGILFCWRRRRRDRQPNGLTRAERRALLKSHQPLPDPSEREKDASFAADLANQQSSRLLAGDRSPRNGTFAKANVRSREMRKSEIALMRARGELPEWNDVPGLSPSLNHLRLADEDPSIAYGVHPSELNNGGSGTSYGRGDRAWAAADIGAEVGPHMRGSRSRNTSLRSTNMPPPPVLRHTPSASGPSGVTYPALSRRPTLGVEPPTITTTRPGQTRQNRLESIDSMAGVPESVYYASGVPVGASVAARKSTDELDKEFRSTLDTTLEFDIDHEMPGVDLADLVERGGSTPTGSSSDPHLQRWLAEDIGDLSDEPPIGALGRTRSTHSSSGSKRSGASRRTKNLDDVARTAIAYPESPVSETGERSRLVHTPSNATSPSVSALSPITRYDSPVERTENIQNLAALPPAGPSPPRSRAAFSNRDSGLGQWVSRTRQLDSRIPEHSRTPLFQRLFDPILTRVRTVSQSARGRPPTSPVGNTPRPQAYAALPPEPELEERSSGGTSHPPSRDWNWKAGPTSYSSGASTSRDDFRKWGRMGGPSGTAPRSSYGGGSALRQSQVYGSGSNSQGGSRAGLSGDEEADKTERGEGSGLGLAGVPPVPEEQDITSAAPLLRPSSPNTPPRAPIREHAEFGLRPPLPPAPGDHRSSQISARTAGSQATQGTAYFDAKSTLASSARDTARGPSPLGQTAWSVSRSLAGTPMMEPYAVGPQDITSTSTSTPVQEVTVIPQELHAPHSPSPPPAATLAPTPQIQHAQPVDVLDVPPPPAATRDFRQQPSLSTVFSVGSLEAFHEALGTGQPEATASDHRRRRSSSVAGAGHRQFSGFSALEDSERFPPPGLAPNPRLSYLPLVPPMPESRPPSYEQAQPRPRSADIAQIFQEQLRRLSRASNGAGSQGSVTSSYGEILPGGILSERNNEGDNLEEDPPMAASQWRVLRGYRRVSNVPDRGDAEGSGTDSSAPRRPGVGLRQHTISARQAEEQASYRLTLGQTLDITSPGPRGGSVIVQEPSGSIHSHRASTHSGNGSSNGNNSQRSKESSNKSHNGSAVSELGRPRPRTLSNPLSAVAHSFSAVIGRRDSGGISIGPSTSSPTRQTFWRRGAQELDSPPLSAVPPLTPRSPHQPLVIPLGRSPPHSPTRHQHFRSEDTHTMVSSSHGHARSPTAMSINTLAGTTVEDIPKDEDEEPGVRVPLSDVEEILEPGQTPRNESGTEDEGNRQFTAAGTTAGGDTWLLVPRWAA